MTVALTVGVLALQGAFHEHTKLLKQAATHLESESVLNWSILEVRTVAELDRCDALIIPGGESTTVSLVAARSNLLDPLRAFVKYVFATFEVPTSLTNMQSTSEANLGYLCRPDLTR